MKFRDALLGCLATLTTPAVLSQPSVGVSVSIQQPGVYGRIEIGNLPPPPVVFARPIRVIAAPVPAPAPPVYLYVPPGHQKHWARHCAKYSACGQPVYFVQEQWVAERYEAEHGKHRGKGKKAKGKHADD
jgi:hypothetical protein